MSAHAANQGRIFLDLFGALRPHVRTDRNLPERLRKLLSKDRRFGSRDRRLYRELLYTALRYFPWIEPLYETFPEEALAATLWLAGDHPAVRPLQENYIPTWPAVPSDLAARAAHLKTTGPLVPGWFAAESPLASSSQELATLHRRAPLWIRIQALDTEKVRADLDKEGVPTRESRLARAYQVGAERDLTALPSFQEGGFEIQDIGSQLILGALTPVPSGRWLDACAGAGGKTLQLAHLVGADGQVDAYEPRPNARVELLERAKRARFRNIHLLDGPPPVPGNYEGVLVDAPCSGSGTWRRSPHLKYTTTAEDVLSAAAKQREILDTYSTHVRSGGRLVYSTCSLSHSENEAVIEHFLGTHTDFHVISSPADLGFKSGPYGSTLLPSVHDSDGFFVACLRRD